MANIAYSIYIGNLGEAGRPFFLFGLDIHFPATHTPLCWHRLVSAFFFSGDILELTNFLEPRFLCQAPPCLRMLAVRFKPLNRKLDDRLPLDKFPTRDYYKCQYRTWPVE